MLITIATFREPQEAHMLRGRLRAEGIWAFVAHDMHVGNNWGYSTALGGAKVQVRAVDADAALEIERACRAGEFARRLGERLGDLDERRCPRCGAADYWKRRPIFQGLLSIYFLSPLWLMPPWISPSLLPPWRWIYTCNACGKQFRQRYGLIGKASGFAFPLEFADATLSDVPEMQQLRDSRRANGIVPPPSAEDLDHALIPSEERPGWVCRIDGMLRGFSLADRGTRELAVLCVDADFERNGIGRTLHNAAVDWLFTEGDTALATVAAPKTKALKFLRAAGWKLADYAANGDYRLELEPETWRERRPRF